MPSPFHCRSEWILIRKFETNLHKERQMEGIAKAKAAGVYKGRPASIDPAQVQQLKAEGMGPSKIAKTLGIGRASVYRALEAWLEGGPCGSCFKAQ
jgi:DNA invertase Pin-like site-specific DNA recombinase